MSLQTIQFYSVFNLGGLASEVFIFTISIVIVEIEGVSPVGEDELTDNSAVQHPWQPCCRITIPLSPS